MSITAALCVAVTVWVHLVFTVAASTVLASSISRLPGAPCLALSSGAGAARFAAAGGRGGAAAMPAAATVAVGSTGGLLGGASGGGEGRRWGDEEPALMPAWSYRLQVLLLFSAALWCVLRVATVKLL
jgi:hypothetical protein